MNRAYTLRHRFQNGCRGMLGVGCLMVIAAPFLTVAYVVAHFVVKFW